MKNWHDNMKSGAVWGTLAVLVSAGLAQGQVGAGLSQPTSARPSTSTDNIGGRYTNSASGGIRFTPTPDTSLLSNSLTPGMSRGGQAGLDSIGGLRAYQSSGLLGQPSVPTLRPMASPLGYGLGTPLATPMASSVPAYGATIIPRHSTAFDPTIKPDSFTGLWGYHPTSLKNVTPRGPTASAVQPEEHVRPPTSQPAAADQNLAILQVMSQRQASRLSGQGTACLQRAIEALKSGNYRGDRANPGAIALFRQARLLLGEQPEPTLGLIASLVSTADYNQAATLIGPLVRKWPDVLVRSDFAQEYYTRPDQMRTHLLAIREAAIDPRNMDLRLLLAFYRWYVESKQVAVGEVDQMARLMGPDSSAAAMVEAMRVALASGG